MKIRDLKPEEIKEAKFSAFLHYGHPTFSDGWDAAIAYVKHIEECGCRCHSCQKPVTLPRLGLSGNYGGDICGELTFCESCWKKLSKEEKLKMANELLPKY